MRPTTTRRLAIALAAWCTTAAFAHSDDFLDQAPGPNGGQLRMAGPYHLELVVAHGGSEAAERPLVVYVTDHDGKKIATAGGTASATLLAGKTRASIALSPDGDNRLKAMARYASAPDLKAVVSVTLPGKSAEQARFTPYAVKR